MRRGKWIATKWLRERPSSFRLTPQATATGVPCDPPTPVREFTFARRFARRALITLAFTVANVYLGLKVG